MSRERALYVCSHTDCQNRYHKLSRLKRHLISHRGKRPFKCPIEGCGKSFLQPGHLKRHFRNIHALTKPERATLKCTYEDCKATFTLRNSLNRHIRMVHLAERFECPVEGCHQSYKRRVQLKIHEYEHTKIKPFECPVRGCGKRFRIPSILKRHQKVHAGYTCTVNNCGEKFNAWSHLVTHRQQHKEKAVCQICHKEFAQKRWLKYHVLVHMENRETFECPREGCSRQYFDKRNLLSHIRTFHDGSRVKCKHEGCGRMFSSVFSMRKHMKSLHNSSKKPAKKKPRRSRHRTMAAILTGLYTNDKSRIPTCDEEDKIKFKNLDEIKKEPIFEMPSISLLNQAKHSASRLSENCNDIYTEVDKIKIELLPASSKCLDLLSFNDSSLDDDKNKIAEYVALHSDAGSTLKLKYQTNEPSFNFVIQDVRSLADNSLFDHMAATET